MRFTPVLLLLLVSFVLVSFVNESHASRVISKRDADYDEHHGLYHHIKRFWKNSWYKAKRGVEGIAEKLVAAVSGVFKRPFYEEAKHHGGVVRGYSHPHSHGEHEKKEVITTTTTTTEETSAEGVKEHGNFDFFGRDALRTVGGLASRTGKRIEGLVSTVSAGLDVKNGSSVFDGAVETFKDHVRAIYPGTLWCGDGTKAKDHEELGHFNDTDACCREHDNCPDGIPADSKKYGLQNTGLFTRSHCDCDKKFYDCLKKADSVVSKKIGFTYFTVLGPQCFKEERIVAACAKTEHGKCVEYEFKDSHEKKYQWFDTPHFY